MAEPWYTRHYLVLLHHTPTGGLERHATDDRDDAFMFATTVARYSKTDAVLVYDTTAQQPIWQSINPRWKEEDQ